MFKRLRKSSYLIVLFFLCLILLFTALLPSADDQALQPRANQGNLDLTQWNFEKYGPLRLSGEWELYWKLLLNPYQVRNSADFKVYHDLPDSWEGQIVANHQLTGEGYATYRLVISLPAYHPTEMALKVPLIYTAYKLWINDKLVASNGLVGLDRNQTKPQGVPQLVFFTAAENEVEIVLQISNYNNASGGVWTNFYFGTPKKIIALHDRNMQIQMFLLGCLVIMTIYYLGIFTFRSSDKSHLYFAIFCLLCTSRVLFVGEILFITWFPELDWEIAKKLEFIAFHLTLPFFSWFLAELYPHEVSPKINKVILGFSLLFTGIDLFTPARIITSLLPSYQIIIVLSVIYLSFVIIKANLKHRLGAGYSLAGGLILFLTVINDILYYNELFNVGADLVGIGLLFFIFFQSINLSQRLSHAFNHNERLTKENTAMIDKIMELNENLEMRIKARTIELNDTIAQLNMEIIERKDAEDKLRLYATTDMMTGLPNRATGMLVLEKQIHLAYRKKWYLTICFLDLDGLKNVNDIMGHHVGDDLIINTARILAESVRNSDTVSRIGGDEFLIVLPQCSLMEAPNLWQKVLANFTQFNSQNKSYQIKASYGFAEYNPYEPVSMRELLEEADNEMYKMKRGQQ